jgi:hypothetical protein
VFNHPLLYFLIIGVPCLAPFVSIVFFILWLRGSRFGEQMAKIAASLICASIATITVYQVYNIWASSFAFIWAYSATLLFSIFIFAISSLRCKSWVPNGILSVFFFLCLLNYFVDPSFG